MGGKSIFYSVFCGVGELTDTERSNRGREVGLCKTYKYQNLHYHYKNIKVFP